MSLFFITENILFKMLLENYTLYLFPLADWILQPEQRLLSWETTTSRKGMKILHGFQLKSNYSHQHPPEELALPPRQPGHASDSWASSPGGGVWAPSDSTTKKKKKKGSFYLRFHSQVLAARTGKLLVKCLER